MEIIDDIMDNFDFERVNRAMLLLDWKWVEHETGAFEVPHISLLRKRARGLLKEAMESKQSFYMIATGGFQADKTTEENKVYLSLSFVLTSWDNYA